MLCTEDTEFGFPLFSQQAAALPNNLQHNLPDSLPLQRCSWAVP